MFLHRDSQDESSHHLDVLPSLLVKVVLTHLWFLVILNVRQKKMGVCYLQLDLISFSLKSSSLHIYLLESGKNNNTQSMCPSSHLLIRCQCKFISLNWADQRFEAHLYTSQARAPLITAEVLQPQSEENGIICLDSFG